MSENDGMDEDARDRGQPGRQDEGSQSRDETASQGLTTNNADNMTPGEMLQQARQAAGYSVEDMCGHTMLAKHTIEALEDDRFDELSQPVFVRGYYRKCAKVLDIDVDKLLAAYTAAGGARVAATGAPTVSGRPVQMAPSNITPVKRRSFRPVFLLIILIVVGLGGYLYWSQDMRSSIGDTVSSGINLMTEMDVSGNNSSEQSSSAEMKPTPAAKPAPSVGATAEDQPQIPGDDEDSQSTNGTPDHVTLPNKSVTQQAEDTSGEHDGQAKTEGEDDTEDSETGDNTAADGAAMAVTQQSQSAETDTNTNESAASADESGATATAAAVGGTELTIKFSDRSWISVRDATGRQLLVGIYQDATRTVDGKPPYKLVIGYGPGVSVDFQGRQVDFNVAEDNTARFTVKADNN